MGEHGAARDIEDFRRDLSWSRTEEALNAQKSGSEAHTMRAGRDIQGRAWRKEHRGTRTRELGLNHYTCPKKIPKSIDNALRELVGLIKVPIQFSFTIPSGLRTGNRPSSTITQLPKFQNSQLSPTAQTSKAPVCSSPLIFNVSFGFSGGSSAGSPVSANVPQYIPPTSRILKDLYQSISVTLSIPLSRNHFFKPNPTKKWKRGYKRTSSMTLGYER